VKTIKAPFIVDPEDKEEGAGEPHGQFGDIEDRKEPILSQMAPGQPAGVSEHDRPPKQGMTEKGRKIGARI
jgi:hypothetical protein